MQLSIIYEYGNIDTVKELTTQLVDGVELLISTNRESKKLKEFVEEHADKIKIIKHSPKSNIAEHRRHSVRKAEGVYLVFICADDKVTSNYVETLLTLFTENETADYYPIKWEFSSWHKQLFNGCNVFNVIFGNCYKKDFAAKLNFENDNDIMSVAIQGKTISEKIYEHWSV